MKKKKLNLDLEIRRLDKAVIKGGRAKDNPVGIGFTDAPREEKPIDERIPTTSCGGGGVCPPAMFAPRK